MAMLPFRRGGPDITMPRAMLLHLPTEVLQMIALETYNTLLPIDFDPISSLMEINGTSGGRNQDSIGHVPYCQSSFAAMYALARTCRDLWTVVQPIMYLIEAQCHPVKQMVLGWAVRNNRVDTLEKAFDARSTLPKHVFNINAPISDRGMGYLTLPYPRHVRTEGLGRPMTNGTLSGLAKLEAHMPRSLVSGTNLLHASCAFGHKEIARFLISKGADINYGNDKTCKCRPAILAFRYSRTPVFVPSAVMYTPLHTAICHARYDVAKVLLEQGASIDIAAKRKPREDDDDMELPAYMRNRATEIPTTGETALHTACWMGNIDLIDHILSQRYQTNIDHQDKYQITPLQYAFLAGHQTDVMPVLLERGADINHRLFDNITLLSYACRKRDWTRATYLLEQGAEQKEASADSGTGLLYPAQMAIHESTVGSCCSHFQQRFLAACLDSGWDPNFQCERSHRSLLFSALASGCQRSVRLLLEKGASQKVDPDADGYTPLIAMAYRLTQDQRVACCANPATQVRTMVNLGVPVNHVSSPRATVVSVNALGVLVTRVNRIIVPGRPMTSPTNELQAKSQPVIQAVRALLRYGADPNGTYDGTPLLLASFEKSGPLFCDILVRAGAKRPSPNELTRMFEIALEKNSPEMLDFVFDLDPQNGFISSGNLLQRALTENKFSFALACVQSGLPPWSEHMPNPLLLICSESNQIQDRSNLAQQFLRSGNIDLSAVNDEGHCPLYLAVQNRLTSDLIMELIDAGADINYQPPGFDAVESPLHLAVEMVDERLVSTMSMATWSTNTSEACKKTHPANKLLMHKALALSKVENVNWDPEMALEIESFAQPLALDENGDTAYSVALHQICSSMVSDNFVDFVGVPPQLTRFLVRKRNDIPWEKKNNDGKSIIDYLRDIQNYLLRHMNEHMSSEPELEEFLDLFFQSYALPQFLEGRHKVYQPLPLHDAKYNEYFLVEDELCHKDDQLLRPESDLDTDEDDVILGLEGSYFF